MNAPQPPVESGKGMEGPCSRYAVDISALLDRELDEAEEAAVWAHLQACLRCAASYEDMRRIQKAVRAFAVFPESSKPLVERVMRGLRREEP